MGLDMYLEAKRKNPAKVGLTGACGGLIPLAPKSDNEEIGYWRKNYSLSEFLWEELGITDNDNCVPFEMSEPQIKDAIEFCENCIRKNPCPNWIDKREWEQSLGVFKNALELVQKEQAQIFYREWY